MKHVIHRILLPLMLSPGALANEHIAQRGDTLSNITQKFIPGRIYGKKGNLVRVKKINEHIKNPKKIYPGQTVYLEVSMRTPASLISEVLEPEVISMTPLKDSASAGAPVPTEAPKKVVAHKRVVVPKYAPAHKSLVAPKKIIPPPPQAMATQPAVLPSPVEKNEPVLQQASTIHATPVVHAFEASAYGSQVHFSAKDKSTGAKGDINSKSNYGARLNWNQEWSSSFKTSLLVDVNQLSFTPPGNRLLNKKDYTLAKFGIAAQYRITPEFSIYDELKYGSELYFRATSASSVSLDKASTFSNKLGARFETVLKEDWSVAAYVGPSVLAGTKVEGYKSKTGFGFHSGASVGYKNLASGIEYNTIRKDTTSLEQTQTELRFFVGMKFSFGQ